jgi:hypothetical protein
VVIFPTLETILNLFLFWNFCRAGLTCRSPSCTRAHMLEPRLHLVPRSCVLLHASSIFCCACAGIQLGPTDLVRRTSPKVLSETLHHRHLARAAGERVAMAVVELDRQADAAVTLHGELPSTLHMLRLPVASPTSFPCAGPPSPR